MDPVTVFLLFLFVLVSSFFVHRLFLRKTKVKKELTAIPASYPSVYAKRDGYTPRTQISKPEPARFDDGPSLLDIAITVAEVEALSKSLSGGNDTPAQEPWEGNGGGFSGAGASGSWDDSSDNSSSDLSGSDSSSDSSGSDSYDSGSSGSDS